MNKTVRHLVRPLIALAVLPLAACGSSSKPATSATSQPGGPAAPSAEAKSAATGDIPDTQTFLTFNDAPAGYSISYPEGWAQTGGGNDVTFRDRNNIIHVVVAPGGPPTAASVRAELGVPAHSAAGLRVGAAQA